MLYFIVTYITNWLDIALWIFVLPMSILFFMSLFLVETPEFLFVQRRYKECLESLNYIAKFNGKEKIEELGMSYA